MLIKIDYREKDLIQKITTILSSRTSLENITLQSENLPLGDIIICEDNGTEKLILERKTLQDLAASIRDGRYKEQSFRLNECNLHNHNIMYLIEGNLQNYKPFLFGKAPIDKYAILSSFVSICYYKGFSLYKSNNIDESAEWIIQLAYKIQKEGGNGYYSINEHTTNETTTNETTTTINDDNYSSILKRTKKNNITVNNIGEIMLSQIPNVSSAVAIAIMDKFKTIKNLIEALNADKTVLNEIKTVNKSGQSRKINKTSIENIYNYLIAETPLEITVNE
jgi:crossover junction endonuclease MUS81